MLELARARGGALRGDASPRPAPSDVGDAPVELLEAPLADFEPLLEAITQPRRGGGPAAAAAAAALRRAAARALRGRPLQPADDRGARGRWPTPARRASTPRAARWRVDARPVRGRRPRHLREREAARPVARRHGPGRADRPRALPRATRPSAPSSTWCRSACPTAARAAPSPCSRASGRGSAPTTSVLLWAGGIWRWLDAITPIRARGAPARRGPARAPRLPGRRAARRPTAATSRPAPTQAIAYARERGLEGECVHFNRGWVPYAEREAYLLEADIGVCAHHDHLEARFSFRTRVLDHFWAGLPSVVSSGDAIGDLVERRGLGRAVAPEDDEGFAPPARQLLDDRGRYAARRRARARRWRRRCAGARWRARWSGSARSWTPARPAARPARPLARATYGQYPDILADLREHGGLGTWRAACRSTSRGCCATGPRARSGTRPASGRASRPRGSC